MKKGTIISAVILTVLGLALAGGALAIAGFDFSKLDTVKYETNTYTADDIFDKIEITSKETDIVFKPSTDGRLSAVCVEREKVKHNVSVENGTLKITAEDNRKWYDHLGIFSKALSMTVYLPSGEYEALKINCRTGDVLIGDPFAFKSAEITASTGDVSCSNLLSDTLLVKTSTGDIKLDKVSAGTIDLTVTTGDITAGEINCEDILSVKVGTGRTNLTDVTCKSLISSGNTGDIVLKNTIASERFNIERGTGDVRFERCDAGEITVKTNTGDVTGTLLSEKIFVAKTSTGSVKVPETTSGGVCKITTSTGDIKISIS
ncbi:MAG: DUF4097 family beta strand repeat protein [Clostridia bacterium]|nr:DUF4097 family beta strand repeat protein [Clostridia bacterium]